jgi:hypothetical protein
MHKLFSKSYYEAANGVQPFWLQAHETPAEDQVSIITTATAETWDEFKKLTEYWEGKENTGKPSTVHILTQLAFF